MIGRKPWTCENPEGETRGGETWVASQVARYRSEYETDRCGEWTVYRVIEWVGGGRCLAERWDTVLTGNWGPGDFSVSASTATAYTTPKDLAGGEFFDARWKVLAFLEDIQHEQAAYAERMREAHARHKAKMVEVKPKPRRWWQRILPTARRPRWHT